MRILITGGPGGLAEEAAALLRARGARVAVAGGPGDGAALLARDEAPDLLLCPLSQEGACAVSAVTEAGLAIPVLAYAARGLPGAAARAAAMGAHGLLPLPATAGEIARTLAAALGQPGPARMVVRDPAMAALLRRAEQVAPTNATVLITGESGTGKELVAAHLHRASGRKDRPFVALNCAAIPDALLESELFGHEKGAFSGANCRRVGKFGAADGGTLLLDEIGEMDLRMQAKVLRAVQEREIDRVGGNRPVPVDVRIVATTNRDLLDGVRAGRFRADLYFRLNVVTLRVPPLRERPDDVPALARLFARRFALANDCPALDLSAAALDRLREYPWPGNVRELENAIHRAVLIEAGPEVTAGSLDLDFPAAGTGLALDAGGGTVITAGRTIEAVEKDMILDTLRQCKGNRAKTASTLGISIRTLRNKLQDYERGGTRIPRPVVVAVA